MKTCYLVPMLVSLSLGGAAFAREITDIPELGSHQQILTVHKSVNPENIVATGYGMDKPVANNSTAQGRALNRRVQLVVSGDAIGVSQQKGPEADAPAAPVPPASGVSNPPQQ